MSTLSNLDSAFLHLETADCPMHVGGIMGFAAQAGQIMDLQRLRTHLQARIQAHPLFKQCLASDDGLHYHWRDDKSFSIERHIHGLRVPGPLNEDHLASVIAHFFAQPLDRRYPLWELLLIDSDPDVTGLSRSATDYAFVCLIKVHHAAVDGISAAAVIAALLDGVEGSVPAPAVARSGVSHLLRKAGHSLQAMAARQMVTPWRQLPQYARVPQTPFATDQIDERLHLCTTLPMADVLAVKNTVSGVTLNDTVLCMVGGGLRAYLQEIGQLPASSLVAMTPVSKRMMARGVGGNQVSSMLIGLGTDIEDPMQRLRHIHEQSMMAKFYNQELQIESLFSALPQSAFALTLLAWKKLHLSAHLPLFNAIVTNIPGPRQALSMDGFPLLALHGVAPIYEGQALSIAVLSYARTLSLQITSCKSAVAQPEHLRQHVLASLEQLKMACGLGRAQEAQLAQVGR